MQIKSIHKMQDAFDKAIKLARFTWRHFFVFCVVGITIDGIASGKIPYFDKLFMILAVAFTLDLLKAKLKISNAKNFDHYKAAVDYSRKYREWATNPSKEGTPAWNCNPFNVGSSAYYSKKMSQYH